MIKEILEKNVAEAKGVNFDNLDFGDLFGELRDAMFVSLQGAPAGPSLDQVLTDMVRYVAKVTAEDVKDGPQEGIDQELQKDTIAFSKKAKVTTNA